MSIQHSALDACTQVNTTPFDHFSIRRLQDETARCARLNSRDGRWPASAWQACMIAGVPRWFAPERIGDHSLGGWDWQPADRLRGLIAIAAADLTTAFVLTQFVAAMERLLRSENELLHERILPDLVNGEQFATVGVSHLATSSRHLGQPILRAEPIGGDAYRLDGTAPWVTGVRVADIVVVGAVCPDGREVVFAVPVDLPGVRAGDGASLIALSGSCTDRLRFDRVEISQDWVVSAPRSVEPSGETHSGGLNASNISKGGTGSLQTSALALGLSRTAIDYLERSSKERGGLRDPSDALDAQWRSLEADLLSAASEETELGETELGETEMGETSEKETRASQTSSRPMAIRAQANDLVIRSTQAALVAAKGAGFGRDHSVGRWCQEALFFLVWSYPEELSQARVRDLAGMAS